MFSLSGNAPHETDSDDMSADASHSETKQTVDFDCKICALSVRHGPDYYGHLIVAHGIPEETAHRVDAESAKGPSPSVDSVSDESDSDCVVLNDAGAVEDIDVPRPKKMQMREKKRRKKRRNRCRKCGPCRMTNCGKCRPCRRMKDYGGDGKLKQACELRQCTLIWPALGGLGN